MTQAAVRPATAADAATRTRLRRGRAAGMESVIVGRVRQWHGVGHRPASAGSLSAAASILPESRWPFLPDGSGWTRPKRSVGTKHNCAVLMLKPAATTGNLPARWYEPRQDTPALFRTFADTPATEEGILRFAERFGMLGGSAGSGTDHGSSSDPT